jgi:hypothetical protein
MRQRLAATIGAIVSLGLFVLTNAKRLADAISLIHLPHDVEELLTSMSATPILISYCALAIGLSCLAYLIISHWRAPDALKDDAAPLLTQGPELPPPLSAVALQTVLWRVSQKEWGCRPFYDRRDPDRMEQVEQSLHRAAQDVRKKALEGLLPIWARHLHSRQFEAVPPEFWRNHEFDSKYSFGPHVDDVLVKATHTLLPGEMSNVRTKVWTDFLTSKDIVDVLWPPFKSQ